MTRTLWSLLFILLLSTFVLSETRKPRTVSLDDYLDMVAAHSREIKMAELDRSQAQAAEREARSSVYPQVHVGSEIRRHLNDTYLYIDFPDEQGTVSLQKFRMTLDNVFGLEAKATQNVFSFAINAALDAADQYRHLTDVSAEAQRREILFAAKKSYYALLLLEKRLHVLTEAGKDARENFESMQKKYDFGQVSQYALLQAEVRWQESIPQTSQAVRDLSLAMNQAKTLAGAPLDEPWELAGDLTEYPNLPPRLKVNEALDQRPDFQALLAREKLNATQVRVESAQAKPSIQADATYTFSSQSDEFSLDRRNNDWNVGLSVSVPVFQGGRIKARVAQAKLSAEKTHLQIEKSQDEIATELSDVRLRLTEARERIASERKRRQTAQKGFTIAETSADNGLITQLELRESRTYLDRADLAFAHAVVDYILAYVDWQRAVGQEPTAVWPSPGTVGEEGSQ